MGLLDALLDPNGYSGQNGGLLDLIRQTQTQNSQYQPGGAFPPTQQPSADFTNRFNAAPNAAPIGVGGYQMPRIGPTSFFAPDPSAIPQNAQPVQGQMPSDVSAQARAPEQPMQLPPALGGNQIGGNLGAAFQNFAGASGPLQALAGGVSGLLTGQRTDPQGMQQQNLKAQYDSLVPVLGPQKAMLAVMNPEAGKTLLTEALTNKEKWGEIGSDSFGNKQYGWINEREQTVNGKPMGEAGAATGSTTGFLAPGVSQIDSSLQGPGYLKQFSPEVQAAVKDYVAGISMPTGNPRKGFTQTVKMIAQKYGADIGEPADDTTFAGKRKLRTDLASSSPNSIGGILSNGKSAFQHLAEASTRMAGNGNYSGPDVPGGAAVAHVGNYVGNALAPTPDTEAKLTGISDNLLKYGQEATKFYAGSGGGEAERMNALKTMDPVNSSGKQQAEFLSTEKSLMLDRLRAKENQVREQLGQEYLDKHPVMTPDVAEAVKKIDENITKLKGETKTAAKAAVLPSGWSVKVH